MPTYDYECTKCGHNFEAFQNIKDKLLDKCPKCKGKVKRLIGSGAGLIFKGSGFYATDYRKKDAGKNPDAKNKAGCDSCAQKHTCGH
jgi:putative FmdB family regulatory protein